MTRPGLVPLFLLLAGSGPGATAAAPATPPHPSAEETRAEFQSLCAAQKTSDDVYFGEALVPALRQRLQLPGGNPEIEVAVRGRLAHELLRLDHPEEAAALFTEARELAEANGLPDLFRLRLTRDLALAHVQIAEDRNCIHAHHQASCILPITAEAVHHQGDDMRKAGDLYLAYLEERPFNLQVRWLLNLARMISGDYPQGVPERLRLPPQALAPQAPFPRWRDIAPQLGVNRLDLAGGAVMEDFDGDGLLDLVTSTWDPCDSMKAYRNDGAGGFDEMTAAWGLDAQYGGLNLVHADFDNDGAVDLYALRGAWRGRYGEIRNSLLHNDIHGETGRFVDVTRAAGVAAAYPTQTAAWADYDGDGDLDLYVGAEATPESPYPSQLLRNDGDGTFTDVTTTAGVANLRFAKGTAWGDYDDDGDPDLYVSNLGPNRLYRNDGDGTFTDVAPELGVAGPEQSFPTWFFDFDNDGDLDLFVADYGIPYERISAAHLGVPEVAGHPVLYRNDGGRFTDVSGEAGFTRPLLPMGANYGDLDNDGFPDLYLGTGIPNLEALMPNVMYRNAGGLRFEDITFAGGFGHLQKGHGIAFGDLDNDGDQDLFEEMGGAYPVDAFFNALYENPGNDHHWITLRLEGRRANRFGVGGRIEVRLRDDGGAVRSVHALVGAGGSFGASSLQQEIGLGSAHAIESITLRWPGSGTVQVFPGVAMDRTYRAVEGAPELVALEAPAFRLAGGGAAPGAGPETDPATVAAAPRDIVPAAAAVADAPAAGPLSTSATRGPLLQAIERLQQDDRPAALLLLEALIRSGDAPPAAQSLREVLSGGRESRLAPSPPPEDPVSRLALAEERLLQRRGDEALEVLAPLVPDPPPALAAAVLRAAGRASLQAGRLDEAVAYLSAVADDHAASAVALAEAHYRQGDAEAALGVLEPFLRDLFSSAAAQAGAAAPEVLASYGRIATAAGRPQQAVPALARAVELAPDDPPGWQALGQALVMAGRREEGAKALERFRLLTAAQEPQPVDIAGLRARQSTQAREATAPMDEALEMAQRGDPEGALELLAHQIEAVPQALEPRLLAITILINERRLDEAVAAAHDAVITFPGEPDAVYHRGIVRLLRGELALAELDFRRTLELAPRHAPALNNLAVVLLQRGEKAEARVLLERVLELAPDDPLALDNLRKLDAAPPG